ncbi:alanine racemase [Peterkaempfera bronchialis]|uniref:Alanine racemase n=1 Tax=Peterkaempfera bronchialis TaxID=2126346 RepID=A0A345SVK5_9ACTN|nr:alanine racemase [Peterkaempfera bronchialis]AXI77760.1 alanine racemase [Peterkaempfera bronchialis]
MRGTAVDEARPTPADPAADDPGAGSAYAEAVVDLGAIARNTAVLAEHAGSAALMAVVKADGFGHGALPVARTALAHGASWLGVTSTAEALRLREAGIDAPMLSWMHLPGEDFTPALRAEVDLAVPSLAHLAGLAASAERAGLPAAVHLKVDTGLHRGGASPADWPLLVEAARTFERQGLLRVRGLWSHLVHADRPDHPGTDEQIRAFEAAVALAHRAGLRPDLLHLANSGAGLASPRTRYDLVRAGIGLYGVEPVHGQQYGLRPAMTLRARAIMARRVPAGEGVSYGHEYTTGRPTGLLLVPVGFADGVPRAAGGRARMWVAGDRRPVAGRIAMDQCVVDSGDAAVAIGEEVVVFGPGDRGEPTAADWADWAATNPHEILTGVGPRVPRRYLPAPAGRIDEEDSVRD